MKQGGKRYGIDRRHRPFVVALLLALVTLPITMPLVPGFTVEIAAIVFFLGYLLQIAHRMPVLTAAHFRASADSDDAPALTIIAVTLLVVAVAVISLFLALNHVAASTGWTLGLAFCSVILGWMTIHTMAAMHYAHIFWRPSTAGGKKTHKGGMDFPDTEEPGGYEFLYYAFVIGMTAQTSDVAITTTTMRKATLVHSIVSFFFNTVLVAAVVNAAVALAG
ncbi:DUF1345 domain-containing protein [Rhizobium sp. S95]|uniref:DUF1345 domain-containing protein n=1 Tax=Ciceribacter sichuanensis TaxID=2949647 RepID=A0AAJ1BU29_9HYPH|nr:MULTISPECIES: DUF1345 domain-containing protein [unclassified Ciceribacter]MCM2399399.1 DUF1345 domain-containing protein [Ciceribacter sp. S95]MCM2401643.1 DUF1345 domain-containing protein [Ciceribacter sp. S153]MCO5956395.1 DUF1345 domain-containing protein [Ciceribacter sp. S101]